MRPRGQTPRMRHPARGWFLLADGSFNEAAGTDPADALGRVMARLAPRVASMRPRGQTPRMHTRFPRHRYSPWASMRPRGQTPRMHARPARPIRCRMHRASMRPRGQTPRMPCSGSWYRPARRSFNEAAGTDPADASRRGCSPPATASFNEAAGTDPADAARVRKRDFKLPSASMRPRGQTPRMRSVDGRRERPGSASMRPRGQTPRMPRSPHGGCPRTPRLQ